MAALTEVNNALHLVSNAQSEPQSRDSRELHRARQIVHEFLGSASSSSSSSSSEDEEDLDGFESSSSSSSSTRRLLFQDRINPRDNQSGNHVDAPTRAQQRFHSDLTHSPIRGRPPTETQGIPIPYIPMPTPTGNLDQGLIGPGSGRGNAQGRPTPYKPRVQQAIPRGHINSMATSRNVPEITHTFDQARQSGTTQPWYPNPLNRQIPRNLGLAEGLEFQLRVQAQRLSEHLQQQAGSQMHSVYGGIAHPAPSSQYDLQGSSGGQSRTNNGSQDSRKRSARELSDDETSPFVPEQRPRKTRNLSSSIEDNVFDWDTDSLMQSQQTAPPMQPGQMAPADMPVTHPTVPAEIHSTDWTSRQTLESRQFASTGSAHTEYCLSGVVYMNRINSQLG
ncbi:hypothetical protein PspLS_01754 [Pyricularia sp. CBS 133598]|nr:hypothetical protein PspLS_01754 [Pyricularia sp. CBS 133598]